MILQLAPDVPGSQMTPACKDKNKHVLREECDRSNENLEKHVCVDSNTRNGVNGWDPVSGVNV